MVRAPEDETESGLTAITTAMWLSVTVSIGDDMMGVFREMFRVNDDVKSCRSDTGIISLAQI